MRYVHSAWGVGEDKILLHTSQVALLKETKSQFYVWNIVWCESDAWSPVRKKFTLTLSIPQRAMNSYLPEKGNI